MVLLVSFRTCCCHAGERFDSMQIFDRIFAINFELTSSSVIHVNETTFDFMRPPYVIQYVIILRHRITRRCIQAGQ